MDTVTTLLEDACEHMQRGTKHDIGQALHCVRVARGRFDLAPINRAARLLYETMDEWATFERGHVRVEVIVQLLQQEGLLRETGEQGEEVGEANRSVGGADEEGH